MYDIDILVEKENSHKLWNSLIDIGFFETHNKSLLNLNFDFQYNGHLPALNNSDRLLPYLITQGPPVQYD